MKNSLKLLVVVMCACMTAGCAEVARVSGELLEKEMADKARRQAMQPPQQQAPVFTPSYKPVSESQKRTVCTKAGNQVSCTSYD